MPVVQIKAGFSEARLRLHLPFIMMRALIAVGHFTGMGVLMHIELSRTTGVTNRVSLFTVRITDPRVTSKHIGFEIPVVDNWCFRPTERKEFYMAPLLNSASPLRGVIVDGEWECVVQSNGVSEEDNPVSREALKEILTHALEVAILPFQENG